MEALKIKCPDCTGITEVARWKTQGVCQYCGSILETARSNTSGSIEKKEDVSGDESVFEALARVDALYFSEEKSFDQVLKTYDDLELRGAHGYEFWLSRARFFAKGNIAEFEAGRILSEACKEIVEQYVVWIDQAIRDYVGNSTPLKMEKEKTIGDINNTFEGHKKRKESEDRTKELSERQRRLQATDDAELAVHEMEAKMSKNRKRNLIILSASIVVVLMIAFLFRACSSEDEADVTYYEKFLDLAYILELFDQESTRTDILNLNIDFGNRNTEAGSIRLSAPINAELGRLTFYFAEEDLLTRLVIGDVNYFNGFAAEDGLDQDFFADFNVEALEENDDELMAIIDDYRVFIRLPLTEPAQFNIEILRPEEELTATQQAAWNQIETRIEAGYDSWGDLVMWAYENDVTFAFFENEARPIEAIGLLINQYGIVGDYLEATPWIGSLSDAEEVILVLHFENLTYNDVIAELSDLNKYSSRELNAWLETGGGAKLDYHFDTVEIVSLDDDGQLLTETSNANDITSETMGGFTREFVSWEIAFVDLFKPVGIGRIRIERTYRMLEIETEAPTPTEPILEEESTEPAASSETTILSSGSWIVGTDIAQGRFVITADSVGYFTVWRGDHLQVNEVLGGGNTGINTITTYLLTGDRVIITDINNVTFTPAPDRSLSNRLGSGNWVVGLDVPAGSFTVTTPTGVGQIIIWRGNELVLNELIQDGNFPEGEEQLLVNLVIGDIITISGVDEVVFE